jgi:hypothetical protein
MPLCAKKGVASNPPTKLLDEEKFVFCLTVQDQASPDRTFKNEGAGNLRASGGVEQRLSE